MWSARRSATASGEPERGMYSTSRGIVGRRPSGAPFAPLLVVESALPRDAELLFRGLK